MAKRTILRQPFSVNVPNSNDIQTYYFNQYNWKGLSDNKNLLVDQETFEDAENVYVDDNGLLKSRPSLKCYDPYYIDAEGNKIYLQNVNDIFVVDNGTIYCTTQGIVYYVSKDQELILSYNVGTAWLKPVLLNEYLLLFTEETLHIINVTDGKNRTDLQAVYIPEVSSTGGKVDHDNELTTRKNNVWGYSSKEAISSNILRKTVNVYIDGKVVTNADGSLYELTVNTFDDLQSINKQFTDDKETLYKFGIFSSVNPSGKDTLVVNSEYYTTDGITWNYINDIPEDANTDSNVIQISGDGKYLYIPSRHADGIWIKQIYGDISQVGWRKILLPNVPYFFTSNPWIYVFSVDCLIYFSGLDTSNGFKTLYIKYYDGTNTHTLTYNVDATSKMYSGVAGVSSPVYDGTAVIGLRCNYSDIHVVLQNSYNYTWDKTEDKAVRWSELHYYNTSISSGNLSYKFNTYLGSTPDTHLLSEVLEVVNGYATIVAPIFTNTTDPFGVLSNITVDTILNLSCKIYRVTIYDAKTAYENSPVLSSIEMVNISASDYDILSKDYKKFSLRSVMSPVTNTVIIIGDLLTSFTDGKAIYDTSVKLFVNNVQLNLMNSIDKSYKDTSTVTISNYYYVANKDTNIIYSNNIIEPIQLIEHVPGEYINIYPDIVVQNNDKLYLAKGNKLYISTYALNYDNEFVLYLPDVNTTEFIGDITALHLISDYELAVFFEHSIYLLTVNQDENGTEYYTVVKSKIPVGCKKGSDVITSFDGQYTIFTSERGLAYMSYQEFKATSEQTLVFLSDTIYAKFKKFNTDAIKLYKFGFYIYCYKVNEKDCYILDTRNNTWWYWNYPVVVYKMCTIDYETNIMMQDAFCKLDKSNDNYYDLINRKYSIPWSFKSQKLYLNAIFNYKQINSITLTSVLDDYYDTNCELECIIYSDDVRKSKISSINYKVNTLKSNITKLNYCKAIEFQYKLSYDDEVSIQTPLSLSTISIKYTAGGNIR